MKKIIKFIITISILILIGYGVYKFFFDCKRVNTEFDRNFILEEMDYAKIDKEAVVKLLDIKDSRCLEENCEREGQFEIKLLVLNDMRMSYVTLGSLSESAKDIEKLGYSIELIEASENEVTLKLQRLEDRK